MLTSSSPNLAHVSLPHAWRLHIQHKCLQWATCATVCAKLSMFSGTPFEQVSRLHGWLCMYRCIQEIYPTAYCHAEPLWVGPISASLLLAWALVSNRACVPTSSEMQSVHTPNILPCSYVGMKWTPQKGNIRQVVLCSNTMRHTPGQSITVIFLFEDIQDQTPSFLRTIYF